MRKLTHLELLMQRQALMELHSQLRLQFEGIEYAINKMTEELESDEAKETEKSQ
jgi:hypothetical protein